MDIEEINQTPETTLWGESVQLTADNDLNPDEALYIIKTESIELMDDSASNMANCFDSCREDYSLEDCMGGFTHNNYPNPNMRLTSEDLFAIEDDSVDFSLAQYMRPTN